MRTICALMSTRLFWLRLGPLHQVAQTYPDSLDDVHVGRRANTLLQRRRYALQKRAPLLRRHLPGCPSSS
jgi:hypothetical protein